VENEIGKNIGMRSPKFQELPKSIPMQLKAFFCDPILPQEIELSEISPDIIIDQFEKIDWYDYFQKIKTAFTLVFAQVGH